jgi:hypothetical protein
MKKNIVASVVGGLILFLWQFLSWTILDMHRPMQNYTPKQQEILDFLGRNLEDGNYYLPTTPKGATMEENEKLMNKSIGKPWAEIRYHKAMNTNMPLNMIRGFLIDIFVVFLFCSYLLKGSLTFKNTLISALVFGLISYLITDYTNQIWFETNTIPNLIDAIVGWAIVGSWLGWWLEKK